MHRFFRRFRTFPDGDFTHHFLPFSQYMADAWRTLTLPLWNPYTYAGHPFWADVQAAMLYPLQYSVASGDAAVSICCRTSLLPGDRSGVARATGRLVHVPACQGAHRTGLGGGAWRHHVHVVGLSDGVSAASVVGLRTAVWLPLILWLLLRAVAGAEALALLVGRWTCVRRSVSGRSLADMDVHCVCGCGLGRLALGRHGAARGRRP